MIGIASDAMTPSLGKGALGVALAMIFVFNVLAAIAYWRAAAALGREGATQ
jgi:hypothetical protein